MERDRMIYTGQRCRVNVKAAFIDMCMESPLLEPRLLMSAVISAGCGPSGRKRTAFSRCR